MVDSFKKLRLVGEFIREKRESLRLSQRALGLQFSPSVSTQFISNVERGVTPLPPVHVPTLAKVLKTSESEIMALLEREYALKLSGRLGKAGEVPLANGHAGSMDRGESGFFRSLSEAYQSAEPAAREAFHAACENILKVKKLH